MSMKVCMSIGRSRCMSLLKSILITMMSPCFNSSPRSICLVTSSQSPPMVETPWKGHYSNNLENTKCEGRYGVHPEQGVDIFRRVARFDGEIETQSRNPMIEPHGSTMRVNPC